VTGHPAGLADNQTYYFEIGRGVWRGRFSFRLTDRAALKRDQIGMKHRLLARGMSLMQRVAGDSRLDSEIWASPEEGDFGVARNVVRISRFRLTLYLLKERYTLSPDGKVSSSTRASGSGRSRSCSATRRSIPPRSTPTA
jgi:hypothetical protein